MLSRIDKLFSDSTHSKLVCFTTAGFPTEDISKQVINNLPRWGADIVEIGMPFSDASADGATIREASRIALEQGIDTGKVLAIAESFRKTNPDTPLILMGYYNPILRYGCEEFINKASAVGVDGLIIVDLPPEEEDELTQYMDEEICLIHLITPTTDSKRLQEIVAKARGFLYYVSVTGTTGSSVPELAKVEKHLKELNPKLPVAIGFGISSPSQVEDFSRLGQAVVVGSALLKSIAECEDYDVNRVHDKLAAQVSSYKEALVHA